MTAVTPHPGMLRIRPHMIIAEEGDELPIEINIASNESAHGPSPAALAAGLKAMQTIERYSETAATRLAHAIAGHFGLDPDGVVCGFGSDDLLGAKRPRLPLRRGRVDLHGKRLPEDPQLRLCQWSRRHRRAGQQLQGGCGLNI